MSFKNISIRSQIQLPIFFMIICLLFILIFSAKEIFSSMQKLENTSRLAVSKKDTIYQLTNLAWQIKVDIIHNIYNPDLIVERIDETEKRGDEVLHLLKKFEHVDELANSIKLVNKSVLDYFNYTKEKANPVIADYFQKKITSYQYDAMIREYRQLGAAMMTNIENLALSVNPWMDNQLNQVEKRNKDVLINISIILIVFFILALAINWWMSSIIVNPLYILQKIINKLSHGDLTVTANAEGSNEFSQLGKDMNQTVEQWRNTVQTLFTINDKITSSSTELARMMKQSADSVHIEQSEIEQVASAVTQLSHTADNVSDHAMNADKTAHQTNDLASQGLNIFQQNAQATEQMVEAIDNTAKVVSILGEESQSISRVVEVIRSISEQTNLLALNAAIEAARAGDTGRGFAVVADEVRMLAARTEESTQEIQKIIAALQMQSNEAGQSMGLCIDVLSRTKELGQEANNALNGITGSVAQITDLNTLVATAAEEQSTVTQDINRSITNISHLFRENVSATNQSAKTSQELLELAETQRQQLYFFKIKQ